MTETEASAPSTSSPAAVPAPPTRGIRGGRLRAILRLAGIALWTAGWFGLWGTGALLTLPVPNTRLRWRQLSVQSWARGIAWLMGMRRRVIGTPPPAPFFLVTNHLSYLDIVLLFTCVDGVFVAKRDMRSWPLLGPLAQLMGTIWVKREVRRDAVRVLDLIDEAIARGDGVMLFPEGTTSSGSTLLPMKPALFDWAAREQYPVHYAAITYRTLPGMPPAQQVLCWWGNMPFGRHVMNVLRMRGFEVIVTFGDTALVAPTRGDLASRVQQAITERFGPVESGR